MNTLTRLALAVCLLVAVGATALGLQSWVDDAAKATAPDDASARLRELARRERVALAGLTVAALAAITVAAALPAVRRTENETENQFLARQGVELLARAAAAQGEALARERDTRTRTAKNLALN
jgi:hypothetical protein